MINKILINNSDVDNTLSETKTVLTSGIDNKISVKMLHTHNLLSNGEKK